NSGPVRSSPTATSRRQSGQPRDSGSMAGRSQYNPKSMDLAGIQRALREQRIDGWLLYDFRGSNPIARAVIGFDETQIGTRRWFYLIPRQGAPIGILHVIEPHVLRGVTGSSVLYRSWKELESLLGTHLAGLKRVAME